MTDTETIIGAVVNDALDRMHIGHIQHKGVTMRTANDGTVGVVMTLMNLRSQKEYHIHTIVPKERLHEGSV